MDIEQYNRYMQHMHTLVDHQFRRAEATLDEAHMVLYIMAEEAMIKMLRTARSLEIAALQAQNLVERVQAMLAFSRMEAQLNTTPSPP